MAPLFLFIDSGFRSENTSDSICVPLVTVHIIQDTFLEVKNSSSNWLKPKRKFIDLFSGKSGEQLQFQVWLHPSTPVMCPESSFSHLSALLPSGVALRALCPFLEAVPAASSSSISIFPAFPSVALGKAL